MKNIFNGVANKPGVYKIINTTNGRIYIGSAKRFNQRASEHRRRLEKCKHHNKFLQHDFNKCGSDAFEFHVVEVVLGTRQERTVAEQKYVDLSYDNQKLCYNLRKRTKSSERKSCSEETRKLISENSKTMWSKLSLAAKNKRLKNAHTARNKKQTYEKISKALTGRKLSPEHAEKARKACLGKKFGLHSEESKQKMILARKDRKQVKVIQDKTINIFPSINACARHLGISSQTVLNVLNKKYTKGYKTSVFVIELTNI